MSLTAECGWTLLRALVVGTLALALAYPLCALIANSRRGRRRIAWLLVLVPYLTPVVLVGYAYSNFSLSLVRYPLRNELFYAVLLLVKLCPVAVVVLYFAPSGLSREAIHSRQLLASRKPRGDSIRERLSFFAHGPARKACVAFAVVFLFAFAEFEMASLLNTTAWTVSLFDAQAGGLPLAQSLRLASLPIICEAVPLLLVLAMLFGGTHGVQLNPERPKPPRAAARSLGWLYITCALALGTAVPLAVVLKGGALGLSVLRQNPRLSADIGASILFAAVAALVAYLSAGWFSSRAVDGGRTRRKLLLAFLLSVPGLLGALLLGLLVLSVFQLTPLRATYDTPLPLVITLMLLLFPFAVLLRVLLHAFGPAESVHTARLLTRSVEPGIRRSGRALISDMVTRTRLWVGVLLFAWGYFEVVASSLLAPSGMTPAFVRLYNLMHYGQITGLSAMVLVSFVVPILLLSLAEIVRGFANLRSYG